MEIDEARFELHRDGKLVAVQPRVLDTILFLARRNGYLVTREELIAGPWKGAPVSDTALSQAIRQARAALGEGRGTPSLIETVRGKGFRFRAEVVDSDDDATPAPSPTPRARPFFGRERELAHLLEAAHAARSGQGSIILLHGPPGVGKTRLVQWFTTGQREQGAEICWGGCREGQSAPPFWPWPEVLHRYAEARDSDKVQELARGLQADLAAMAPELGEVLGVASGGLDEGPERALSILESGAEFLKRASLRHPLIVVLEDLHLADDAALRLLEVVARSIAETHLLIIGTCRSAEGTDRAVLKSVIEGALPHSAQVPLDGLSLGTVREWLESVSRTPVPDDVVAALHYSTEGLPLLLENLVYALPSDWNLPELTGESRAEFALPDRLKRVLRRRLDELDQGTVQALRMAAVFGEEFPMAVLASAARQPMSTLLSALDRAERMGLLKPADRGHVRFAHALHRDLLYHELTPSERHEHHHCVARAFADQVEHRPELVLQAAHHFLLATPVADPHEAVDYAKKAAEWSRSRHAYARAAEYYQRALEILELAPQDSRERCELLLALGHTQYVAGLVDDALETLDLTFELSRAQGMHDLFCRALLTYFQLRRESTIVDQVFHQRLAQALENGGQKDGVYAQLQVARALATTLTSPVAERVSWLEEALELTRVGAAPRDRLEVLRGALRAYTNFTNGTTTLMLAEQMLKLSRRLGSAESELEAQQWRAHALLDLGRGVEFVQQCGEHEGLARVVGSPHASWLAHVLEAGCLYLGGSLAASEALVRTKVAAGEQLLGITAVAHVVGQLMPLALEAGTPDKEKLLGDAIEASDRVLAIAPNYQVLIVVRARLRLYLGDDTAAQACLKRFVATETTDSERLDRNFLTSLVSLADIACVRSHLAAASKLLKLLHESPTHHVVSTSGGCYHGPVTYWLGRLNATLANFSEARSYFEAAIRESERSTSVTFRAWSAFHLAQLLSESEASRKQELLESARDAARRCGMGRLQTELEQFRTNLVNSGARGPTHSEDN